MKFVVNDDVLDLGVKIVAFTIKGVNNKVTSEEYLNWRSNKVNELINKYKDYDIKSDLKIEGYYDLHAKVNVPRRKNLPASENLIRLLTKREELIMINPIVDIYNIFSIDSKICVSAHDIDKVVDGITLKICDGSEKFVPLGSTDGKCVNAGEYCFVDGDNEVVTWLDIRQVDKTKVTLDSTNIFYFVIGNSNCEMEELKTVANSIIEITNKYCGGKTEYL